MNNTFGVKIIQSIAKLINILVDNKRSNLNGNQHVMTCLRRLLRFLVESFLFACVDRVRHQVHIPIGDIFVVHRERIHRVVEYSDVYV
jgi:hypothetical protein